MNLIDLSPQVAQAKAFGRGLLAVSIVVVAVVGLITAVRWVNDPFGLGKAHVAKVETQAVVNGQQAASNAAGAAINDQRATNVAKIHKTGQEARDAVIQSTDPDDAVGDYLDGLDRVRNDGRARVSDPEADGG
jgi:hypothetical protein